MWTNGPYEAGMWPDIEIFRDALISELAPNKRLEADDGSEDDAAAAAL